MIVKAIPSSWLIEEEHRLDCGPYVKGSKEARKAIENLPCPKSPLVELTLEGLSGMYHVGQDKIVWAEDSDHGMPFLRSADVTNFDLRGLPFISRKQVAGNHLFQCPVGSTLITRSGTIGKMAYMRPEMEDTAISQDVLKVVPDPNRIPPGYLYAFLRTKYGIPIIVGGTFGSIIVHIEAENIASLPVPRLGDEAEQNVGQLIGKSAELISDANYDLALASRRYLRAAGLDDITATYWHTNSGRLGFATPIGSRSLRAMNYLPINQDLEKAIREEATAWRPLIELVEPGTLRSGPRFKRIDSDPEYGVELIGQGECFNLRPSGRWIAKKYLPTDKLLFPPDGTVLIAAQGCAGEHDLFGRAQFITGKRLDYAYSQHFLRVIAIEEEIPRGALFAYLNSQIAYRIRKGYQIGSMQQDFHPDMIKDLPVPIIDRRDADEIDAAVRAAYQKFDNAIDAEDEAIALVERAIEEGGS
jgi:type I restriction enzyme S subunit